MKPISDSLRGRISDNLFPAARQAVEPWESFRWHGSGGECDTWQRNSSQALAIDVFGTLKMAEQEERERALGGLARRLGVAAKGPWKVELEWQDATNRLREPRPTQVDAVAAGRGALIFFECKFTESAAGDCSQTHPLGRGHHAGQVQCDGRYRSQVNPVTKVESRCALTGKGIRYWERIPRLFRDRGETDDGPCPFAGPWFQWMRNVVLCEWVASHEQLTPAFVVVYADAPGLPFAEKMRRQGMADFQAALRPEAITFQAISYQSLLAVAEEAASGAGMDTAQWQRLREWVETKINDAAMLRHGRSAGR